MKNITMSDIAKEAKVSRPTVSLVLNNSSASWRISEKTRVLVLTTAKRLGYRKNLVARSMVTGKTKVIGFVARNINEEYIGKILEGIITVVQPSGYIVKTLLSGTSVNALDIVNSIIERRPDGIICHGRIANIFKKAALDYNIPIALVDSDSSDNLVTFVNSDDRQGASLATRHLIELGHKKIAHATTADTAFTDLRKQGYLDALNSAGIRKNNSLIVFSNGQEETIVNFIKLFRKQNRPTAVFCATDPIAMYVIRATLQAGLKIPEDVSIVGYANMFMTSCSVPPLTTIEQPFSKMGEIVAESLIKKIEGNITGRICERLETKLILRNSTCVLRKEKNGKSLPCSR